MARNYFTRVQLKNWKNFIQADTQMAMRTFLIGANAAGKSNFLDVFRFLRDLSLEDGGGLVRAVAERGGMSKIRSVHARGRNMNVMVEVQAQLDQQTWSYHLEFGTKGPGKLLVQKEKVECDRNPLLDRPDDLDQQDPGRLSQTSLHHPASNKNVRLLAEFFRRITYLHMVPQVVRENQGPREGTIGMDPYGRDLLNHIQRTPRRMKSSRLGQIEKKLRSVVPNFEELEQITDQSGRPHLNIRFRDWRNRGTYQNEQQFSDGTLRLIGLLWALQEKSGPLLLEEPELSLHSGIIKQLATFMARTQNESQGSQVIVSTHSEDLLADEGIRAEEVLLVSQAQAGSSIQSGAESDEVKKQLGAGLLVSEVLLPKTQPKDIDGFSRDQL